VNLKNQGFTINEDKNSSYQLRISEDKLSKDFNFGRRYEEIADFLLNGTVLMIGGQRHRFMEIEFYYYDENSHPDVYSHQSEVQYTFGNWYFHTWIRNGQVVYRDGAQTGVDISIGGQQGENDRGGILIRSIKDSSSGKVYCGPGAVMNRVLKVMNCNYVDQLVEKMQKNIDITNQNGPFHITIEQQSHSDVFKSSRVGLFLTKNHYYSLPEMTNYVFNEYRFFCQPSAIFKGTHYIVISMYEKGLDLEQILSLICYKEYEKNDKRIECLRYIENYEKGKTIDIQSFVGEKLDELQTCVAIGAVRNNK